MPDTVAGVPLHPLIVHAVVVLAPLGALGVIALALVPSWRYRFGGLVSSCAVITAILVPFAIATGRTLEQILGSDDDIQRHQDIAQTLIVTAPLLALAAIGLWWIGRRDKRGSVNRPGVVMVVAAFGVIIGAAVGVQAVLIGHSGAEAAWGVSS